MKTVRVSCYREDESGYKFIIGCFEWKMPKELVNQFKKLYRTERNFDGWKSVLEKKK